MKTKANSDFFIKDLGDRVELTTTLFLGLINGIQYLAKEGYDIIEDSCTVKGLMYIIPAYKPKERKMYEDTQKDSEVVKERCLDDLTKKDELLEYASDTNIVIPDEMKLPSQIKKYIKQVEENEEKRTN